MKSQLIGKDPSVGKDWGQEEKEVIEDEMVGWHHCLSRHEFEQTLGDRSMACYSPWGCKESDITEQLNNKTPCTLTCACSPLQRMICNLKPKTILMIWCDCFSYSYFFQDWTSCIMITYSDSAGKESTCNVGELCSIPGLGRCPGGRAWQPTLVFHENPHGQRSLAGLQSMGSQRVQHNWATKPST